MNHRRAIMLVKNPNIVRRGLKFSAIVGTILVLINHGNRIVAAEVTQTQILQILLTYMIPYIVSCLSSIQSIMDSDTTD